MAFIGYVVMLLGVALIVIGVFGAGLAVLRDKGEGFAATPDTFVQVLKQLPKLIEALAKAPKWLSMTLIGLLLVWAGDRLTIPAWPFA
jgi:hypothetical protein